MCDELAEESDRKRKALEQIQDALGVILNRPVESARLPLAPRIREP